MCPQVEHTRLKKAPSRILNVERAIEGLLRVPSIMIMIDEIDLKMLMLPDVSLYIERLKSLI